MTAPAPPGAPTLAPAAGVPDPPGIEVDTFADQAEQLFVDEQRRRRLAWAVCLAVLVVATAATVGLLLVQWMATGSGTVAR